MFIAVIGPIASGKGTAARWLAKAYGFKKITMSMFLREELIRRNIKPNREVYRDLQAEFRKKYGEDYLINQAVEHIQEKDHRRGWQNVVIDGLRTPHQARVAKKRLRAKIILVDAAPFIRYKRAKERHRAGFAKTYEEFLHEDAIEAATFDFHVTKRYADFKIFNNGDVKSLQKDIDKVAKKLGLKKVRIKAYKPR